MKHRKCEICLKDLKPESQWTICAPCDLSLKIEQQAELIVKEKKWAASHKCRKCGDGLPLTRYFECLTCNDPDSFDVEMDEEEDEALAYA